MRAPVVKLSLVREKTVEYEVRLSAPEAVAGVIRSLTAGDADESFFVIALDVKNRINHVYTAAKGGASQVSFNMRDLFRAALIVDASGIIVAHNHPSGDPTPSGEDIRLTRQIADVCKVLGLRFLDSLVVGDDGFKRIET